MAWRTRDATIFLIDVGRAMKAQVIASDSTKVTRADVALRVARNAVQQKLLFTPKHEVGIIFFGTVESRNDLDKDGYEHVFVARDGNLDVPDLAALRSLTDCPPSGAESDAIDALIVALDLMIKKTAANKYSKTIVLMTDGASATYGDEDLQECVKQLELTNTKLCIALLDNSRSQPWEYHSRTSGQIELRPLASLAHEYSLCVKPVEQRAKVRLNLTVSPDMQIPVGVYSRTTRVGFPTLKRRSKLAAMVPPEHQKTDNIVTERTFHVADDPNGEEVVNEDRIKGHRYGQSIVPMSEYDEAALMYKCERTLTALGFAPSSSIGAEHSVHQVECVAADRGDLWAFCALESLVAAMMAENVVLIARYCFRSNSQPRMVTLIPQKSSNGNASFLDMQYLPFFEDIREWSCSSLPAPSAEQRNVVAALVDALDLCAPAFAAEPSASPQPEALRPEDTHNPSLSRFYNFLVQRAMNPGAPVLPPGPESLSIIERPQLLTQRLEFAKLADQLNAEFGLQKVEKAQGRTKRFWREAIAEKRKDFVADEVDTKRIKVEVKKLEKEEMKVKEEAVQGADTRDGSAWMAAPVGFVPAGPPLRVHIGSVHPERDFEHWLAQRAGGVDTVSIAIQQMCEIIDRLAEEGEEFHGKALSSLTVLRRGCVHEGEAKPYNEFVKRLSCSSTQRRQQFWLKARAANLGLITDAEVPTSTICAEEARAFLAGEDSRSAQPASVEPRVALSEHDLEAMIE